MSTDFTDQLHTNDACAKSKRGSLSIRQINGVSQHVIIVIVLGIIGVISCAMIAFLLWRLGRIKRQERRKSRLVDLLGEARFSSMGPENTEKGLDDERYKEKPLPRLPSDAMDIYPDDRSGRKSLFTSEDRVEPSMNKAFLTRLPFPAMLRKGTLRTDASIDSSSLSDSKSSAPLSSPRALSSSGTKSNQLVEDNVSSDLRERFAVVNVTEADDPRLQRAQLVSGKLPDYTSRIRGRDMPFPSRTKQALRDASTIAGPSYTVHLPGSSPGSDSAPTRARSPLTITTSRPVSNVVVGDLRTIRGPSGMRGKSRVVTLSVLVEDSEPSSADTDAREGVDGLRTAGTPSPNVLDQVLESYVSREGDLPPYTPRDEGIR